MAFTVSTFNIPLSAEVADFSLSSGVVWLRIGFHRYQSSQGYLFAKLHCAAAPPGLRWLDYDRDPIHLPVGRTPVNPKNVVSKEEMSLWC